MDEPTAERLGGFANHGISLAEARANYKSHFKMYPRGYRHFDDSPAEIAAKQEIVAALQALKERRESEHEALWATIERAEALLDAEFSPKFKRREVRNE